MGWAGPPDEFEGLVRRTDGAACLTGSPPFSPFGFGLDIMLNARRVQVHGSRLTVTHGHIPLQARRSRIHSLKVVPRLCGTHCSFAILMITAVEYRISHAVRTLDLGCRYLQSSPPSPVNTAHSTTPHPDPRSLHLAISHPASCRSLFNRYVPCI